MLIPALTAAMTSATLAAAVTFAALAAAAYSASPSRAQQPQQPRMHTVKVKFDYNFHIDPACPAQGAKHCVKQFNVYNLTDRGVRTLLFTIPAPAGAHKLKRGIKGTSRPLNLAAGVHQIAVTAVWDNGAESNAVPSATMVKVSP